MMKGREEKKCSVDHRTMNEYSMETLMEYSHSNHRHPLLENIELEEEEKDRERMVIINEQSIAKTRSV